MYNIQIFFLEILKNLTSLIYFNSTEVEKGCASLNARFFGGRVVTAEKYDQDMYEADDLSG